MPEGNEESKETPDPAAKWIVLFIFLFIFGGMAIVDSFNTSTEDIPNCVTPIEMGHGSQC